MNNDLISREALKKALEVTQYNDIDDLTRTERLIDNAEAVEVPENTVNCVLTMFGECSYNKTGCSDCEIKDKIRKALEERPQGEWIEDIISELESRKDYGVEYAQAMEDVIVILKAKFGADMRVKDELGGRE